MIISAMPTIGKTTLAQDNPNIIDLDSGMFNEVRSNSDWIYSYCNVALYLESKGYIVLVRFNHKFHSYLKERAKQYLMIAYDYSLKNFCLSKAIDRYNDDPENVSLRTTNWIVNNFDTIVDTAIQIAEEYNIDLILIKDKSYNLKEIIENEIKEKKESCEE